MSSSDLIKGYSTPGQVHQWFSNAGCICVHHGSATSFQTRRPTQEHIHHWVRQSEGS